MLACYPVDAVGLAAYELWRDVLQEGHAEARWTLGHARALRWYRQHAAAYVLELATERAEAHQPIAGAAVLYDREMQALQELEEVCRSAAEKAQPGGSAGEEGDAPRLSGAPAQRAADLVGAALAAEREAVARIGEALVALGG